MTNIPVDEALSDEELELLSDVLKALGPSALNLEGVDGLFCALICGPELVMPREYLPEICGRDFDLDEQEDPEGLLTLLARHWNMIARTLLGTLSVQDVYMPYLVVGEDGVARGNDWAEGFMRGAMMRPKYWLKLMNSEKHGGWILPMMALAHEHHPDPKMRPSAATLAKREDLLVHMIAGLTAIYKHFEPLRGAVESGSAGFAPVKPRTGPKIGRNEPCPCGSGKKYKRCCAMRAPMVH